MRVLNVNATLDSVEGGGTAERTIQLSSALVRAGHRCTVITLDLGDGRQRLAALPGVEAIVMRCISRRYLLFAANVPRLRQAVREADVVHLLSYWTLLNVLVARLCRAAGTPYVVSPAGELIMGGRSPRLKRYFHALLGRGMLRGAAGFIAITADEVRQFEAFGVDPQRVTVIPNGVALPSAIAYDGAEFRRRHKLGAGPIVLFLGRLAPIKGPDLLLRAYLDAAERLGDAQLVFAGPDFGMLDSLREEVRSRGAEDRVRFIGFVGGDDKWAAYAAASLVVIPSRNEAMSIVVLEAGAVGTPVLLTDRCGFPQVREVGGGAVVPATANGLHVGLLGLLRDPTELNVMGERLRRFVSGHYLWSSVVAELTSLYERITGVPSADPNSGRAMHA